ncbi:sirohydrochlorin chelatase [Actinomyces howellii]|uniref:Sirohydrochlorin cobaltochelatase n=1 Tax=Actinomyces howellii TaxID=52771 RepID=A0A3S4R2E3_9ACTO|nr:sirohydrochlorin chelatase [Actinomyces howellii]VEG26752.1 Sirohydrochlorin cobaltochelatase [Actinomyces howellii]
MTARVPAPPRPAPRIPTRPSGGHGPEPHGPEPHLAGHGAERSSPHLQTRRHESKPAVPAGRSLVLLAHGSGHPEGRAVAEAITRQVSRRLGSHGARVTLGFLREMTPSAAQALEGSTDPVVLPLFLGRGYHVRVDIPRELSDHGSGQIVPHLGSSPRLVPVLCDRLDQAGAATCDAIVLAAAGSSDPGARQEVVDLARALEARLGRTVEPGYLSAASPRVVDAVSLLRSRGHRRVAVSSLLLSDGVFQQALGAAGADVVTAPLGAHPEVVEAVVEGYRAAAVLTGSRPPEG